MTTVIEAKFGAVPVVDAACDAVHVAVLTQSDDGTFDVCAGITRAYYNDAQRNARAALVATTGRVLPFAEALLHFPNLSPEQYRRRR